MTGRRVVFVIDTLEVGGAEESLVSIATRLRRFLPSFVVLYRGDALGRRLRDAGIPVFCFGERRRYAFGSLVRRLRALLAELRPAVVHSTLFRSDVVARVACLGSGARLVSSLVNDSYGARRFERLNGRDRLKLRGVQMLDCATACLVDRFAANADAIRPGNAAALGLAHEAIGVIPRGRDLSRFSPKTAAEREGIRRRLGLNGGYAVLAVGRLLQRKGHALLVEAFARFRRQKAATLLIVGEGPERGALERLAVDAGVGHSVRFFGTRSDVPDFLAAADLFVFPSEYEGFPGALLEAMAVCVPIVASDIVMNREVVGDDGAVFVVGDDPDRWCDALLEAAATPSHRAQVAQRGRERAVQLYDIASVAEQHDALYESLLRGES